MDDPGQHGTSPDGELSVLLTNLPNEPRFAASAIIGLYFRRRAVEVQYRDEKSLDIRYSDGIT